MPKDLFEAVQNKLLKKCETHHATSCSTTIISEIVVLMKLWPSKLGFQVWTKFPVEPSRICCHHRLFHSTAESQSGTAWQIWANMIIGLTPATECSENVSLRCGGGMVWEAPAKICYLCAENVRSTCAALMFVFVLLRCYQYPALWTFFDLFFMFFIYILFATIFISNCWKSLANEV